MDDFNNYTGERRYKPERECNKCVYSTRDGNCRKWDCDGTKTVDDIKMETIHECVEALKGLDPNIAAIFENIVMNAKHYEVKNNED